MADLSLSVSLNPASAALFAGLPAEAGTAADTPAGGFAALLGRQLDALALAPGVALLPLAEAVARIDTAEGAVSDDPAPAADLAALFSGAASVMPVALAPLARAVGDAAPGATGDAGLAGTALGQRPAPGAATPLAAEAAAGIAGADGKDTLAAAMAAGDPASGAGNAKVPLPTSAAGELPPPSAGGEAPSFQAALSHAAPAPPSAQAGAGTRAEARIDAPVSAPAWGQEIGQRLVWMAGRDQGHAELTLTPPSLGKLEVVVSVQGGDASAHFVSASAAVREALEQALPRLREVLAQAGLSLGETSVNAESPRGDPDAPRFSGAARGAGELPAAPTAANPWTRRGSGLIDTFA